MSDWLRWRKGRQNDEYDKFLLARSPKWRFDAWILRYPEGAQGIPVHRDTVQGYRHYRLNIVLKKCKRGGYFRCEAPIYTSERIKFFRSDFDHTVSPIKEGKRVLLSIGWLRHV